MRDHAAYGRRHGRRMATIAPTTASMVIGTIMANGASGTFAGGVDAGANATPWYAVMVDAVPLLLARAASRSRGSPLTRLDDLVK